MKALFLGADAYAPDANGKRDETEATECTVFGMTFRCEHPMDISGLTGDQQEMLRLNRMFMVMIDGNAPALRVVGDDDEIIGLRSLLDSCGVKYNHRAGSARLWELLAEATA